MTDKQIIIDFCPYQGECSVSGCKRNDDGCFVRQLFEERYRAENQIVELNKKVEAKEQECERLKKEIKTNGFGMFNISMQEQLDQLKAENEGLKKCYKNNSALLDFEETNTTKLVNKVMKLEKTLTEIKEIVGKNYKTEEELFKIRHSRLPKFSMGALNGRHNLASETLQKISEVEDEN